ncbi:MAG TPA: T9SS type A sorting domain-containing protein [Cryomorphaceae bacterium]|nr:T9SS type A sorting domain-containing protein [Cryomorphaceae bacterium]
MKTRITQLGSALFAFFISITGIQAQESECADYRFYYSNAFAGSSSIYEVLLSDGVAEMNLIEEVPYHAHIAFDKVNKLLYVVNGSTGSYQLLDVAIADGSISTPIDLDINLDGVIAASFNHDNKLLIGAESSDKIYIVNDLLAGSTQEFADAPVQGGDIAFDGDGQLLLATRAGNGKLFRINTFNPVTLEYPVNIQIGTVPSLVTGIAKTENGNILLSANGADEFVVYNSDGSGPIEGQSYETPFTLANGDLAGGCYTPQNTASGCYAAEVLAFEQGLKTNGTAVAEARSNPDAALGQPDASNQAGGFVSLGVGGYIILGFDGAVFDQDGADINIFETSFSGDNCGFGDDEFAVIKLSNGGDFISVGEICRDGSVDIADAGLSYVTAIKIINSSNTNTPDGYDVDGIEAIYGCGPAPEVTGCENFKYYYIADNTPGFPQGTVFEGTITGGDFVLTELFSAGISSHLAVNNLSNELYVINGNVLRTYTTAGVQINEVSVSGGNYVAAVWNPEDGLVYAAAGNTNNIYKFNPLSGDTELVVSGAPVSGGDLIIDEEGNLLLVERINSSNSRLHLIENGTATLISDQISNSVNGAALTAEGGIIAAEGNNSNNFFIYDIDGTNEVSLNAIFEGEPFPVVDGDMASGCIDGAGNELGPQLVGELTAFPNPTAGPVAIEFSSASSGRTILEIIDMNGRIVTTLFDQVINSSEKQRVDFNGISLPNGIYITKLSTENGIAIDKIMISK